MRVLLLLKVMKVRSEEFCGESWNERLWNGSQYELLSYLCNERGDDCQRVDRMVDSTVPKCQAGGGQDKVGGIQHQPDMVHKHRMVYILDRPHYHVQDALEGQPDDEVLLDHGHPNIEGGQAREESY